jgi:presenilin-like A22 family membrane protease
MPLPNLVSDELRVGSALIVGLVGLVLPALLVVFLVCWGWKQEEVSALVGLFTGLVGTMVGAFLGAQVGAAGKQRAEELARRALAALDPQQAERILNE